MTTDKAPQGCWVVLDEKGWPTYCAGWPEACHEHINDAILDLPEAAKWRVVQMEPATKAKCKCTFAQRMQGSGCEVCNPAPTPDPVEIEKGDTAAWAKVDAYISNMQLTGADLDVDWTTVQFVEDELHVNAIVGIAVPVGAYRG